MKVNGEPTRSIRSVDGGAAVEIIDQTMLPHHFEKRILSDWRDCVEAICSMRVRGAPLIGITGAWAVALAVKEDPSNAALKAAADVIAAARPTAVNLSWAVRRMMAALMPRDPSMRLAAAVKLAEEMTQEDVLRCRAIGEAGKRLLSELYKKLRRPVNVLTHCNAGWLATVDYGTALSPIYMAFEEGTPLHVWVDETRPRLQGLLTAWELGQDGVPHTLVADNAGGQLMQRGDVDIVIVGADRITRRGDAANKIGTYLKALAAKDCDVPFYVAAPSSTVDWTITDGCREIPIEDRGGEELRIVHGLGEHGESASVRLFAKSEPAANPAFDVTPARLITGIITERGIAEPSRLAELFPELQPKTEKTEKAS
ncbi:MAG: Methylthioribose-1-phosphate isomerase [Burkholderia sp.]|jgi:methylthioribose-1-phosphate isomerase